MERNDERMQRELTDYLAAFVSERRRGRMEEVLAERTRFIAVVLEDLFQPHNASAVLRSCDCFGVQDVHIVEGRNAYRVNADVDMGASGWLTMHRYGDMDAGLRALRQRGYRLVAATPHRDDCSLDDLPVDRPLAVLFGTEEAGLSDGALAAADEYVRVPMYGFSESFNISVCAALILRELTGRLRAAGGDWGLSAEEKAALRLEWYRRSVRGVAHVERRFMEARGA